MLLVIGHPVLRPNRFPLPCLAKEAGKHHSYGNQCLFHINSFRVPMSNSGSEGSAPEVRLVCSVHSAMLPYLQSEYANASEPYSFARTAKAALRASRETIAACINADPEEIFFTSGGTESDNWALKGTMLVYGDRRTLITSRIEHHAVLHSAEAIERMGYPVVYLPVDRNAVVLPEALSGIITDSTKLVSVMLSNNEVGTIQPIRELADIAHRHGALFHTDAVQAFGHEKIDVNELNIDIKDVAAAASIDLKSKEKGLLRFVSKYHLEYVTYSADELNAINGEFEESEFVKK